MDNFKPHDVAVALGAKLAARSRHVCMFLGAGVARACGLPDVALLRDAVVAELEPTWRQRFESQLEGRTFEQALSRIRRIAGLLGSSSGRLMG